MLRSRTIKRPTSQNNRPSASRKLYSTKLDKNGLNLDVKSEGITLYGDKPVQTTDLFAKDKTVVAFGLPGAFTPVCTSKHVPSYIEHFQRLKDLGVDDVVCISVNDAFVMDAWGKSINADGKVKMLGDPMADFTKSVGLDIDLSGAGLGLRSKRYSMIVKNAKVVALNVEEQPNDFGDSSAETAIKQLEELQ
eukprot:gb/GECH01011488.1/.p1 GENE.gb/GECH01011488.1/~~gb/GECH01011488.1/.p1  ORF type:complete len:192 (+),score=32.74 gb/GECH01011488.1/:1-576(+)